MYRCKKKKKERVRLPRQRKALGFLTTPRGLPLLHECKMSFVCCSLKFGLSGATLVHCLPRQLVKVRDVVPFSYFHAYFRSLCVPFDSDKMVVRERGDEQQDSEMDTYVCVCVCVCVCVRKS